MELGNRIKEARISRQLTQKDVVGEYMTRNMLSKIENGSAVPSVKTLEYLAGALSMPVGYFLDGTPAVETAYQHEISRLADDIISEAKGDTYALALCVKAWSLLSGGDSGGALKLLESCEMDSYGKKARRELYLALEQCCKAQNDYKRAYECACRRMELDNGV